MQIVFTLTTFLRSWLYPQLWHSMFYMVTWMSRISIKRGSPPMSDVWIKQPPPDSIAQSTSVSTPWPVAKRNQNAKLYPDSGFHCLPCYSSSSMYSPCYYPINFILTIPFRLPALQRHLFLDTVLLKSPGNFRPQPGDRRQCWTALCKKSTPSLFKLVPTMWSNALVPQRANEHFRQQPPQSWASAEMCIAGALQTQVEVLSMAGLHICEEWVANLNVGQAREIVAESVALMVLLSGGAMM